MNPREEELSFQTITVGKEILPSVSALLSELSLPTEGIEDVLVWIVERDRGELIGCVGLEVWGAQGLLRSLAVKEEYRRAGIGSKLVERLQKEAKQRRISELYLLTETAQVFFQRKFGFSPSSSEEKDSSELSIKQSKEFSGVCSKDAILLKKKLE